MAVAERQSCVRCCDFFEWRHRNFPVQRLPHDKFVGEAFGNIGTESWETKSVIDKRRYGNDAIRLFSEDNVDAAITSDRDESIAIVCVNLHEVVAGTTTGTVRADVCDQ